MLKLLSPRRMRMIERRRKFFIKRLLESRILKFDIEENWLALLNYLLIQVRLPDLKC